MRLTIINQFYVPDISPTAHLSASLAEHRAAQGDEVTVITSRGGYVPQSKGEAQSERDANPAVHRVWTPQLGKKSTLKRCIDYACFYIGAMIKAATLPRQDVIISLTTPPYIAWAAVLHRIIHRRTKIVLWSMDCYPDAAERLGVIRERGLLSRVMRWANKQLYGRLDHLVCLDSAMVDLLGQYTPTDRSLATTIIPNWEDRSRFGDASQDDEQPWQPDSGVDLTGQFVVLYLGNAGYGHQFETVLEAAEKLRDELVTFLFVGGGKRWDELAEQKRQRGLDNIVLQGYVAKEDTIRVMRAADCALITLRDLSLGVMSPSKLHANLAMSLPVAYIGPVKSNVDDAITRFDCGVSLRHGDVDGLLAFIDLMRSDRSAHEKYRRAASDAFDQAYCDEQTLPQFDALLADLTDRADIKPLKRTVSTSAAGRAA